MPETEFVDQISANLAPGPNYVHDQFLKPLRHQLRFIAFYLPQFHRTEENDVAWGKGFTEWTNVSKAIPRFVGHYQPHLPGGLGFYDLRLRETLREQAGLANRYGISGFCFHYYWFGGKRLLDTPLRVLLNNPDIEIPFCVNWANENWTRSWDGGNQEVLQAQNHSPQDDLAFARSIEPLMRDPRYIRIHNRPLLLLYRPRLLPDASATVRLWRGYFADIGVGDPYIALCHYDWDDPRPYGMDAAVGFPPHRTGWCSPLINNSLTMLDPAYRGSVRSYEAMAKNACELPPEEYTFFHGVCPSWDNEARQPSRGLCFFGSSPESYGAWLAHAARRTIEEREGEEQIVFINAWNEWAEGAHLEPDRHFGYAYLAATRRVLEDVSSLNAIKPNRRTRTSAIKQKLRIGNEVFWSPDRLVPYEHWVGHIPFAFWIVKILEPRVLVELGTHSGNSYCAFCQAINTEKINCAAFAVDSWAGDVHMKVDPSTLEEFQKFHDPRFFNFSTILRMSFEEARPRFSSGSVDLLHLDGTHSYDAVRNDFELWSEALSDRAVVLFHDTSERQSNFGVWRLWEELTHRFPNFEFCHSHGLGVLGVGRDFPTPIRTLFSMSTESDSMNLNEVRRIFSERGDVLVRRLRAQVEYSERKNSGARLTICVIPSSEFGVQTPLMASLRHQTQLGFKLCLLCDNPSRSYEEIGCFFGSNVERVSYSRSSAESFLIFNHAIQACASDYIMFARETDYYMPTFVEVMLQSLSEDDLDMVLCNMIHNDDNPGGRDQESYRPFVTLPKSGSVDLGSFILRTNYAKSIGFKDKSMGGDGVFIDDVVTRFGNLNWKKVEKILFVRNSSQIQ